MLRILADLTNRITIIMILLMGIGIGAAHLLLPLVEHYRAEVEQAVGAALGKRVSIQSIHGRWRGFGPQLALRQVELYTGGSKQSPLHLDEIRIGLGLLDSLTSGHVVPSYIELVNASLRLHRDGQGDVRLLGVNDLDLSDGDEGERGIDLKQLPAGIGLVNSQLLLESPRSTTPLRLYNLNMRIRQGGEGFKIKAQLQVGGHTANQIEAAAEVAGDINDPSSWNSRFYLSGKALAIDALLQHFTPPDFTQITGLGDFELWGQLQQGKLTGMEGSMSMQGVAIERLLDERRKRYSVDHIQGVFRWLHEGEEWRFEMTDTQLRRGEEQWPSSALILKGWQHDGALQRIEGEMDFFRLQDVLSVVEILPAADHGLLQVLQNLHPAGDIKNLAFSVDLTQDSPRWSVAGELDRARCRAWDKIPGTSNISASFQSTQDGGSAELHSDDILLSFENGLFRNNLRVSALQGSVHWQRNSEGWLVASEHVRLNSPDFKTRSRFTLELPNHSVPTLDLHTAIDYVDVAYIRNYLPAGIMNKRLIEWVDQALVSGRVQSGSVILNGPLTDFPYDVRPTGHFEATLAVEEIILDYKQGWPRLENASAELRFINNSFDARVQSAEISASRVNGIQARVDVLDPASPLELEGSVDGPLADALRLLTDSPLSARFGEMASGIVGHGGSHIAIKLSEPLDSQDERPSTVRGTVRFNDNSLEMDKWDLALQAIQGELEFDEKKVWAKEITTTAFDRPLTIHVVSPDIGLRRTEIHASGHFSVKELADRYLDLTLPHIQGATDWQLMIDVPHASAKAAGREVELSVRSELQGVAIDLPTPLGKPAEGKQSLRISLNPDTNGAEMPVRVRIGDLVDAHLGMVSAPGGKRKLDRVEVCFGGVQAKRPPQPGLFFNGRLSRFRLDPWIEMFTSKENRDAPPIALREIDVDFGRFEYKDLGFDQIHIKGSGSGAGWQGYVDSPQVSGMVLLPMDLKRGTVMLDLEHYTLVTNKEEKGQEPSKPNSLDPRELPSFEAKSKRLIFNGQDLGALTLKALRKPEGLFFDEARVVSDWFKLNAKGSWSFAKPYPISAAMFKIETTDLGRVLTALSFAANVKEAPGRFEGNLTWPGDPTNINDLNLSGKLELYFKKGSFVDMEPGAGRFFGLLNLGALQRRLTLDFSDFFGKGFGFDRIKGAFTLDSGDAFTHNLTIEAPTGTIEVSGRTGLISRDYDQIVNVIPDVTGTLATAGALAAGPVIGAALFVTSKVLGKELNKVSKAQYEVKGPWDKPSITSTQSSGSTNNGTGENNAHRVKGLDDL